METIQDELNTTEEKPRILNMKNDWNDFFSNIHRCECVHLKITERFPNTWASTLMSAVTFFSFGISPLLAACQGLSMLKLPFVTKISNFSDPNRIQLGGNLNIPLKILLS